MKTTRTLAFVLLAVGTLAALAVGQATQPTRQDRLVSLKADGSYVELFPADARWPVVNRDIERVYIKRPGSDALAEWVVPAAATQPATVPTTAPATKPAVEPVVMPPLIDPAKVRIAPNQKHRGDGWSINRPGTYKDLTAVGFEQNVVVQGFSGDVTLDGLVSCDSWDDDTWNRGQLLYADFDGVLYLRGSLLWGGGWQDGRPADTRTWFKHAVYGNAKLKKVVAVDCVIGAAAAAAIQSRCDLELVDSVVIDCGSGINPVLGKAVIRRVTVYGAHRYFDGSNWTGAFGLLSYTDTDIDDGWFVAGPRSADPFVPGAKGYDMGPVAANRKHPQYPTTGGVIKAKNCRIVGPWRASSGEAFAGDMGFDGKGFELVDRPPVVVDYMPVVNRMRSRELSVPDGRRLLERMIRDAAPAGSPAGPK